MARRRGDAGLHTASGRTATAGLILTLGSDLTTPKKTDLIRCPQPIVPPMSQRSDFPSISVLLLEEFDEIWNGDDRCHF